MVAGDEARLQLPDPVSTRSDWRPGCRRAGQTALVIEFIKAQVVERTKCCRQAAERADEANLRREEVDHRAEAGGSGKRETTLGFALYVNQRLTRRKQVRDE